MIDVEGLTFTYAGAPSPAITDLTFDVREGEIFGFLGPSGAGKSTTQNVLIGLLRGAVGRARLLGRPVEEWGSELYRSVGVSFESPNHYLKLTARENLEYFRDLYGDGAEATDAVLEWVDLLDHAEKRVEAFSKGMKNRLNLARSLLHRPRLWFLDEPTAGLDPVNAKRVRELIRGRRDSGVTTFLTTHDMQTVEALCDRVAFLVDGRIAIIDAPDALRRRYGRREVELTFEAPGAGATRARFPLDDLARNADFHAALARPGLATLHSLEASLEDVFVQVTGRGLE
ncbi:MAG: ABC transporter ATP-binding protein [Acidobacteriota bacterium]